RLEDAHAHLGQELGLVHLTGEGDLRHLDRQLDQVVSRVREVVARSQQQQQEMLRAEQLAAVGQLAASVAHEVRNPVVSVKLPDRPVLATLDRGQFTSVLVNLLLNALDAMPHGGRLSVVLSQDALRGVLLAVADTGTGIDPSVLARLFTPFISTKPTGTGLGL